MLKRALKLIQYGVTWPGVIWELCELICHGRESAEVVRDMRRAIKHGKSQRQSD